MSKSKKPVSDRKLKANRANAKKSTGPRTEEGKARSRQNALQHGLLARYVIPENDPVEKAIDYEAMLYEFHVQFHPQDLFECMCIRRLANCHWRLDRAMRYEIQAIENARTNDHTPMSVLSRSLLGTDEPDPARHVLPPGLVLDRLIRYETMINRELQRVLNQLRDHRKQPAEALEWSYKRAKQTQCRVNQGDVCPFCGETMKLPLVPPDPEPNEPTAGGAGVSPASTEPTPAPNEPNPAPEPASPSQSLKSQISDLESPPAEAPNEPKPPPSIPHSALRTPHSPSAPAPNEATAPPSLSHFPTCSPSHVPTPQPPEKQNEPKNPNGTRASAVSDGSPIQPTPSLPPQFSARPLRLRASAVQFRVRQTKPNPRPALPILNSQLSILNSAPPPSRLPFRTPHSAVRTPPSALSKLKADC